MQLTRGAFAILLVVLLAGRTQATPFFARKYGFDCARCHSGFPRLNAFGLAFKANNFRLPGLEGKEKMAWERTIPLAAQVKPTDLHFFTDPGSSRSQFTDTQILSGGLLTQQTAFYLHHSLFGDAKPVTPFPSYELWIQQVLGERGKVMLKAGQFELPYAYSPMINRTTISAPLVMFRTIQNNDASPADPMSGLQLSGLAGKEWRWFVAGGAPAAINGGNLIGERQFFGRFRDVFLRAAHGPLTRNVSGFLYFTNPPRDRTDPSSGNSAMRIGAEGTLFYRGLQIQGMALYGENDDATGTGQKGTVRGAFLEVDRMVKPWLGLTFRYDIEGFDRGAGPRYHDGKTFSMRVHPVRGVKLQAEYQFLDHGNSTTGFVADVAF